MQMRARARANADVLATATVLKTDVWYRLVIPCFAFPFMGEVARGRSEVQGRRKWPLCFRAATRAPASAGRELARSGRRRPPTKSLIALEGLVRSFSAAHVSTFPRFHVSTFPCPPRLRFDLPLITTPGGNSRPPIPRSAEPSAPFWRSRIAHASFSFFLSLFLSFLLSRSVQPETLLFFPRVLSLAREFRGTERTCYRVPGDTSEMTSASATIRDSHLAPIPIPMSQELVVIFPGTSNDRFPAAIP